jgi:1,2-phenylacetyl-CoA epoxidase catalytic subunit
MKPEDFVDELEQFNRSIIDRIGDSDPEPGSCRVDVVALLRIALKNELEATELAACWLPSTPELDVKLGLARQVGDEAKHYRLLKSRIEALTGRSEEFDPRTGGYSPLFEYLRDLTTSVERMAAGQFTREALAQRRNEMFVEYLKEIGDLTTASLYEDIINPDEDFHHQLGRAMLIKYATTPEVQEAARAACRKTLEIAENLRAGAILRTGVLQIPGC